jgi:hypothetical protein
MSSCVAKSFIPAKYNGYSKVKKKGEKQQTILSDITETSEPNVDRQNKNLDW